MFLGFWGCASGPKMALDPESDKFYETARLIMTGQEKTIFNHLPDAESRKEFIDEFWAKRDPDPATHENEFQIEFFRRIQYANQHFNEGVPGWKTDRGRFYIYLGNPDKVEDFFFHHDPDVQGPILWWIYYDYELGIEFADKNGNGAYEYRYHTGYLFEAIESAKLGLLRKPEGGARFVDFNAKYDRTKRQFIISLPLKSLTFKEEGGVLKTDWQFFFYLYEKKGGRSDRFEEARHLEKTDDDLTGLREISFSFPYELKPGSYFLDVKFMEKGGLIKGRKIFEVKGQNGPSSTVPRQNLKKSGLSRPTSRVPRQIQRESALSCPTSTSFVWSGRDKVFADYPFLTGDGGTN